MGRLLIVSNRLPFTVTQTEGRLEFQESTGGLVSGLSAYLDSLKGFTFAESNYIWLGWPGLTVNEGHHAELKTRALADFNAYPVFLSESAMDKFFHGFCNKTIWPLFHYFPSLTTFDEELWQHYVSVNQAFAETVLEILHPDDLVWIHDYHLMLLPKILRERVPHVLSGFFLHIPFPVIEVFRLLPRRWGESILEGLLGADLIGFHTHDYTQAFLKCALRMLGYDHSIGIIRVGSRIVKADTLPMGIDFDRYHQAAQSSSVQAARAKLAEPLTNVRVVLSIDRLDYTKGIINRLRGFELFLERNPEWHDRVVLSLIVVPSRVGVQQYQQTKKQIDELVGQINGRFGGIQWTPVVYQYRYLPLEPLVTWYTVSDIALVTPLRDGMNLVAKEYVAARTDQTGVLILSEMAGAAKELGEAIIISPNSIEEIADALKQALEMPTAEQMRRMRVMQTRLKRYNVVRWANDFIQTLRAVREQQEKIAVRYLDSPTIRQIVEKSRSAQHRLFLLDYDGTLVPLFNEPHKANPPSDLLATLKRLAEDPKNEIVLICGRDRNTMQDWFGALDIGIAAEHGAWIKERNTAWRLTKPLKNDWKPSLLPILERRADRLPGAIVEEKEFSIVWHFRGADPELGALRAQELLDDLVDFATAREIQIFQGDKMIEVRNSGVNKGTIASHWLSKAVIDFILAAGDDETDEDLFRILPSFAYSIRIGVASTHAGYNLLEPAEMTELLRSLAQS